MTQIETHVFGSKDGYETLAHSSGLSPVELVELDGLGFGQSSDPSVLVQLSTNPTALGRFLSSGRFAITRCVQGPPDDAGRATFRLLTVVLAAHDYLTDVRHRLSSLLQDQTLWDVDRFANQKSLPGRSRAPSPRDARTSAIAGQWAAATGPTRTACFVDESDGDQLVLRVASELPEIAAQQLNWGVRLFSAGTQATLFTTVPGVPLSASRKIVRVRVSAGSPEWDPHRFGQRKSGETTQVRRTPIRLPRNPMVLSALATLVILIVGFWPSGFRQAPQHSVVRSSAGVQERSFDPSQRTLDIPSPPLATEPEQKSDPGPATEPEQESDPGPATESEQESEPGPATEPKPEPGEESEPEPATKPKPEPEQESEPGPTTEPKPEPEQVSEPEPKPRPESKLDLEPNPTQKGQATSGLDGDSTIDCERWRRVQKEIRREFRNLKNDLDKVAEAQLGHVEVDDESNIHVWSNDFPEMLLRLKKQFLVVQNFSKVPVQNRGHPPSLSHDPSEYSADDKIKVMVILEYWTTDEQEVRQMNQAFNKVFTKAKKFDEKIENRESGYDPDQQTGDAWVFAKRLVDYGRLAGFTRLLDDYSGAEGDLFRWVNVHQNSSYGELVAKSKEVLGKDGSLPNDISAPTPGLLLDELPCQGGTDEPSD